MSKFKFGDEVVAIKGCGQPIKKGNHYIIDGFACCPNCGMACVYIKGFNRVGILICSNAERTSGCGYESKERENYDEATFEKLISLAETTEYRLRVSIPELIEIKEPQLQ